MFYDVSSLPSCTRACLEAGRVIIVNKKFAMRQHLCNCGLTGSRPSKNKNLSFLHALDREYLNSLSCVKLCLQFTVSRWVSKSEKQIGKHATLPRKEGDCKKTSKDKYVYSQARLETFCISFNSLNTFHTT